MITWWARFRPNLYVAGAIVAFIWYSSTLPSHYTADEFMRSARFAFKLLGGYLVIAAVVCAVVQAGYESRVRDRLRAKGYAVSNELTVSAIVKYGLIVAAVIYGALHFRNTDSKLTGPAKSTSQRSAEPR